MSPRSDTLTPEALLSHADFVHGLARSLLGDTHAADDVAQETLVRALERPPRSETGLRAWLFAVTRNFARQRARGEDRRRHHERAAAREEPLPSTADVIERETIRSEVVRAALALDEPYRTTVLLRHYEGKQPREIARRLGVPVETVRTRLKRGLARMRARLDERRGREEWTAALVPLSGLGGGGKAVLAASATTVFAGTGFKLAAAGVLALGALGWLVSRSGPGNAAPTGPAGTTSPVAAADLDGAAHQPLTPPAQERNAVLAATDGPIRVAGRALGPDGTPLVGEHVYLSPAGPSPVTGLGRVKWAYAKQGEDGHQLVETGDGGSFVFELEEPASVHVGLVKPASHALYAGPGLTVQAPASGVELRATPAVSATLSVRVRMSGTEREVSGFSGTLWSTVDRTYQGLFSTRGAHHELPVYLREGVLEEQYDLTIEQHEGLGSAKERVVMRANELTELLVYLDASENVAGQVVDENGDPVADALVYFGIQELLRGDEPFKPYDPKRIRNGARTGEDGRFELEGNGRWITAWHADLNPATVSLEEVERIVLGPRAVVQGLLTDDGGAPVAGATLTMDRVREAVTDANGRFRFEGLEAGIRGIRLASGRMFALSVAAGETLEVELGAGLPEVTIELQQEELPFTLNPKDLAIVVGAGRVFSVQDQPVFEGRIRLENVLPGEYHVLCASGIVARVDIQSAYVAADVGKATIALRAEPGRRLYVAPANANELVRLLANRIAARAVPSDGVLTFSPLPVGKYVVGAEGEGAVLTVDVGRGGVEATVQ